MVLPPTTKKEKELQYQLYRFRFLTISHLQKLFHHKDPHRIKAWVTDLKEKGYIGCISDKSNVTKPYIFHLESKSRHILKENEACNPNLLRWLYKEKTKTKNFINRNLFIADLYFFFCEQKGESTLVDYFTQSELWMYDYFPEPLPDAYITELAKDKVERYFLDYFDEATPSRVIRGRLQGYLKYLDEGDWSTNTDDAPFPTILFICANERMKKHIVYYGKAVLEKSFADISFFVTTKDKIRFAQSNVNIWETVD